MPTPSSEQKFNFLKRIYFGVTNNPTDDVNPYNDLIEFGNATVGTLRWGNDIPVRQRSKIRFAHNYHNVLVHYKVNLPIEDIFSALDDRQVNNDVVLIWVGQAVFH